MKHKIVNVVLVIIVVFCYLPIRNAETDKSDFIFIDNKNGTITDLRSNLMWLQDANFLKKEVNWTEAYDYCNKLDICGYSDWYLPSATEFLFLFKTLKTNGSFKEQLEAIGFKNIKMWYWTTEEWNIYAVAMNIYISNIYFYQQYKNSKNYAWPVRKVK